MSGEAGTVEAVQEGSRWIHARPKGEDFAKWFIDNVRMHEGMDAELYVPGITLIPGSEKLKVWKQAPNGRRVKEESYRDVFTPYAKVDTRIAYFWDLCEKRDWVGEIEKVVPHGAQTRINDLALPEGFFCMPYPKQPTGYGIYLCCAAKINIYRRSRDGSTDRTAPAMLAPTATKVVPFTDDVNNALRCETGAIGRALGMAGMLVIPGSGVATAEDMQELAGTPAPEQAAALPDEEQQAAAGPADIRGQIAAASARLESEAPGKWEEVVAWAGEKKIDLSEPKDSQLRAVLRKLEAKLAEGD